MSTAQSCWEHHFPNCSLAEWHFTPALHPLCFLVQWTQSSRRVQPLSKERGTALIGNSQLDCPDAKLLDYTNTYTCLMGKQQCWHRRTLTDRCSTLSAVNSSLLHCVYSQLHVTSPAGVCLSWINVHYEPWEEWGGLAVMLAFGTIQAVNKWFLFSVLTLIFLKHS